MVPGPMSFPAGDKSRYAELSEIVCNVHFNCDMRVFDKHDHLVTHDYITFREWLSRRGRLETGKTRG